MIALISANQETIVELLGFARRVFPSSKSGRHKSDSIRNKVVLKTEHSPSDEEETVATKTELTFDFHRLNILLLRASVKDGLSVGRKICTATMMEAKIKATVGRF